MARKKRRDQLRLPWRVLPGGQCYVTRLYEAELGVCRTETGFAYQVARGERVLSQAGRFPSARKAASAAMTAARSGGSGLAGAGLAVRSHTYRGRQGFLIYGTDPRGHSGQRVFCATRKGAEAVRDAMRRGDDQEVDRLLRAGA